jgi:hypothetical protein
MVKAFTLEALNGRSFHSGSFEWSKLSLMKLSMGKAFTLEAFNGQSFKLESFQWAKL